MKLKNIFSKNNMFSFVVGAVVVGAVAGVAVAGVAVGGVAAGVVGIVAGIGGAVVIGVAAAIEKKFGLKLKFVPLFTGLVSVVGIALANIPSNTPQANQELSAVSESATVQTAQAPGNAVDHLRISFSTATVDPDSTLARLSDNTGPVYPSYELRMA